MPGLRQILSAAAHGGHAGGRSAVQAGLAGNRAGRRRPFRACNLIDGNRELELGESRRGDGIEVLSGGVEGDLAGSRRP